MLFNNSIRVLAKAVRRVGKTVRLVIFSCDKRNVATTEPSTTKLLLVIVYSLKVGKKLKWKIHTTHHCCTDLVRLVVEHHQIPVGHVEPREMLASILGIKYILVHHKGCTLGVGSVTSGKKMNYINISKTIKYKHFRS